MWFHRRYFLILAVGGLVLMGLVFFFGPSQKGVSNPSPSVKLQPPPESLGPYAYQVSLRFYTPQFSLLLTAKELYFIKGKLWVFRTRLFRRLVFTQVTLAVFRHKEKLLEIRKDRLELNPDLKKMVIRNPQILFIKGDFIPSQILIDPRKGLVLLKKGIKTVSL